MPHLWGLGKEAGMLAGDLGSLVSAKDRIILGSTVLVARLVTCRRRRYRGFRLHIDHISKAPDTHVRTGTVNETWKHCWGYSMANI